MKIRNPICPLPSAATILTGLSKGPTPICAAAADRTNLFAYIAVSIPMPVIPETLPERRIRFPLLPACWNSRPAFCRQGSKSWNGSRQREWRSACEDCGWLDEAVKAISKAVDAIGASGDTCFILPQIIPPQAKEACHLGRIPLIMYWPGHLEGGRIFSQLLFRNGPGFHHSLSLQAVLFLPTCAWTETACRSAAACAILLESQGKRSDGKCKLQSYC